MRATRTPIFERRKTSRSSRPMSGRRLRRFLSWCSSLNLSRRRQKRRDATEDVDHDFDPVKYGDEAAARDRHQREHTAHAVQPQDPSRGSGITFEDLNAAPDVEEDEDR